MAGKANPRKLTIEEKHFIVTRLACYWRNVDVVAAFQEEFGRPIERNVIGIYDPTKRFSREGPSGALTKMFYAVREKYDQGLIDLHPISKRAYRVNQLGRMFERTMDKGNVPLAASLLKQAADEMAAIPGAKEADDRRGMRSNAGDDGFDGGGIESDSMRQILLDAVTRVLDPAASTQH